jgi:hypothetical protein
MIALAGPRSSRLVSRLFAKLHPRAREKLGDSVADDKKEASKSLQPALNDGSTDFDSILYRLSECNCDKGIRPHLVQSRLQKTS